MSPPSLLETKPLPPPHQSSRRVSSTIDFTQNFRPDLYLVFSVPNLSIFSCFNLYSRFTTLSSRPPDLHRLRLPIRRGQEHPGPCPVPVHHHTLHQTFLPASRSFTNHPEGMDSYLCIKAVSQDQGRVGRFWMLLQCPNSHGPDEPRDRTDPRTGYRPPVTGSRVPSVDHCPISTGPKPVRLATRDWVRH